MCASGNRSLSSGFVAPHAGARTFGPRTFRPRTFQPGHFGHGRLGHGKCRRWTFRPKP